MKSLTIKLEPIHDEWLTKQSRALNRSKGEIVRELIQQQLLHAHGTLGQSLSDLCGALNGSKNLSTRPLKGYGRS